MQPSCSARCAVGIVEVPAEARPYLVRERPWRPVLQRLPMPDAEGPRLRERRFSPFPTGSPV